MYTVHVHVHVCTTCACTMHMCTCMYNIRTHVHIYIYMCTYIVQMYMYKVYPFVSRALVMCAHVHVNVAKMEGYIHDLINEPQLPWLRTAIEVHVYIMWA